MATAKPGDVPDLVEKPGNPDPVQKPQVQKPGDLVKKHGDLVDRLSSVDLGSFTGKCAEIRHGDTTARQEEFRVAGPQVGSRSKDQVLVTPCA